MMVANGALLGSLAGSILELSETYKCGSIVRGLSRRITVRAPPRPGVEPAAVGVCLSLFISRERERTLWR